MTVRDGVVAILFRGAQVLLIQRGAEGPFPGYWAPVSGKVVWLNVAPNQVFVPWHVSQVVGKLAAA